SDGAFPGLLLIFLPEEGAISIPDGSIFACRNGRICRELRAGDDACDLIAGADVLAAVGYAPDDSRGGWKYGYALGLRGASVPGIDLPSIAFKQLQQVVLLL